MLRLFVFIFGLLFIQFDVAHAAPITKDSKEGLELESDNESADEAGDADTVSNWEVSYGRGKRSGATFDLLEGKYLGFESYQLRSQVDFSVFNGPELAGVPVTGRTHSVAPKQMRVEAAVDLILNRYPIILGVGFGSFPQSGYLPYLGGQAFYGTNHVWTSFGGGYHLEKEYGSKWFTQTEATLSYLPWVSHARNISEVSLAFKDTTTTQSGWGFQTQVTGGYRLASFAAIFIRPGYSRVQLGSGSVESVTLASWSGLFGATFNF